MDSVGECDDLENLKVNKLQILESGLYNVLLSSFLFYLLMIKSVKLQSLNLSNYFTLL